MENEIVKLQDEIVDAAANAFKEDINSVAGKVMENAKDLEIMPINSYVLVKPYEVNPYDKIEVSEGGLAMNTKEHKIFNQDKGEEEKADMWERVGVVIEVSPNCKYVQKGDDIFYRMGQRVPISFLQLGMEVVAESSILAVVNAGLTERFKGLLISNK